MRTRSVVTPSRPHQAVRTPARLQPALVQIAMSPPRLSSNAKSAGRRTSCYVAHSASKCGTAALNGTSSLPSRVRFGWEPMPVLFAACSQGKAWPQHYSACVAAAAQLAKVVPPKSDESESESESDEEVDESKPVNKATANSARNANSKKTAVAASSASGAATGKGTAARSPKSDCLACQGKHRPHTCKGRQRRRRSTH